MATRMVVKGGEPTIAKILIYSLVFSHLMAERVPGAEWSRP